MLDPVSWFCLALLAVELEDQLSWYSGRSRYLHAPWHSSKAGGMLPTILILTFVAWALGECCPNFGIDLFGVWVLGFGRWVLGVGFWVLGFRFEVFGFGYSLDHPKVAQITSKSTPNRPKIIKNWYLEWLWAPLGSPWRPLGHHLGPRRQKPSKK